MIRNISGRSIGYDRCFNASLQELRADSVVNDISFGGPTCFVLTELEAGARLHISESVEHVLCAAEAGHIALSPKFTYRLFLHDLYERPDSTIELAADKRRSPRFAFQW